MANIKLHINLWNNCSLSATRFFQYFFNILKRVKNDGIKNVNE